MCPTPGVLHAVLTPSRRKQKTQRGARIIRGEKLLLYQEELQSLEKPLKPAMGQRLGVRKELLLLLTKQELGGPQSIYQLTSLEQRKSSVTPEETVGLTT